MESITHTDIENNAFILKGSSINPYAPLGFWSSNSLLPEGFWGEGVYITSRPDFRVPGGVNHVDRR